MKTLSNAIQTDDYKNEKHVPVIEALDSIQKGKTIQVTIRVGKEVGHPNTTQHHISWISLFFLPKGEKFPVHIGDSIFAAHGSSVEGPDTSTVYTNHCCMMEFKTDKPGTLMASSYCNIHGLWESSKELEIE